MHEHGDGPHRCREDGGTPPDLRIGADGDGSNNEVGQVEKSSGDGSRRVLAEDEACRQVEDTVGQHDEAEPSDQSQRQLLIIISNLIETIANWLSVKDIFTICF